MRVYSFSEYSSYILKRGSVSSGKSVQYLFMTKEKFKFDSHKEKNLALSNTGGKSATERTKFSAQIKGHLCKYVMEKTPALVLRENIKDSFKHSI